MVNAANSTVVVKTGRRLGKPVINDRVVYGRYYSLHAKIGMGGMAAVYLGWLSGDADFSRVVAIKRMHPQFALDEDFAARFRDEAHLCARLSHPNIVQVFDVIERNRELLIVMEFVHGVSLSNLVRDAQASGLRLPPHVIAGVLVPALQGLHAAHDATDDDGNPICIVHRDFSPQNIMVSGEGHAKILDFGVAKARTHLHVTSVGRFSGKLGYCSPEQIAGGVLDRRTDVFAAGIVLWEMLTGQRLFYAPEVADSEAVGRIFSLPLRPPSSLNPEVPARLDEVVLRALQRQPEHRFGSARELASELEAAVDIASLSTISEWVNRVSAKRMARLARILGSARRRMAQSRLGSPAPAPLGEQQVAVADAPNNPPASAAVVGMSLRRPRRWWAIVAVAALVLSVAGLVRRTISKRPALVPAPTAVRPAPQVSPVPAPPKPMLHLPAPAPPSEPVVPPMPAQVRKLTAQAKKPHRETGKAEIRRAAGSGSPRRNCNPPTYLDADGIRIFKDECL